jgi:hypothetical protein
MRDVRTLLGLLLGYEGTPDRRAQAVGRVVLDLLMEVEALRRAVQELSARAAPADAGDDALARPRHGLSAPRTVYAEAYADSAWLTHFSAGPSSGWEKLLAEFYPGGLRENDLRELELLRRLGVSDADLAAYAESARGAETCT